MLVVSETAINLILIYRRLLNRQEIILNTAVGRCAFQACLTFFFTFRISSTRVTGAFNMLLTPMIHVLGTPMCATRFFSIYFFLFYFFFFFIFFFNI